MPEMTELSEQTSRICQICSSAAQAPYSILETELWRIRHSEETRILGYCILEPKRHILDLSEANDRELVQYGKLLSILMKAQRELLACQRVYTFSLAEAVPHFHLHVIPRDKDFVRAYIGRGIMSYPLLPKADPSLVESVTQALAKFLKNELRTSKLG